MQFRRYLSVASLILLPACAAIEDFTEVSETVSKVSVGKDFHACMKREGAYSDPEIVTGYEPGTGQPVSTKALYSITMSEIVILDGVGNRLERCALLHIEHQEASAMPVPGAEARPSDHAVARVITPGVRARIEAAAAQQGIDPKKHVEAFSKSMADFLSEEMRAFYRLQISGRPSVIDGPEVTGLALPVGETVTRSDTETKSQSSTSRTAKAASQTSADRSSDTASVTQSVYRPTRALRGFWQPSLDPKPFKATLDPILVWRGGEADMITIDIRLMRTSAFQRKLERATREAENAVSDVTGALQSAATSYLSGAFPVVAQIGGQLIGDIGQAIVSGIDRDLDDYVQSKSQIFASRTILLADSGQGAIGADSRLVTGGGSRICVKAELAPDAAAVVDVASVTCRHTDRSRTLFQAALTVQ